MTVRRTLLAVACLAIVAAAGSAVPVGRSAANSTGYSVRLTIKGKGIVTLETRHPGCNCLFKVRARRSCSSLCHFMVKTGTGKELRLVAAPAIGWRFASWQGCTLEPQAVVCHLRYPHTGRATATFAAPGSRQNPHPLGTAVTLEVGGFRLRVNSAILDANAQVEAVTDPQGHPVNPSPPTGLQYALLTLTLTNTGADPASPEDLFLGGDPRVFAWYEDPQGPQQKVFYTLWDGDPGSCKAPPLDLNSYAIKIQPGQTVTGNLCLTIGSQDASTSILSVTGMEAPNTVTHWFLLH